MKHSIRILVNCFSLAIACAAEPGADSTEPVRTALETQYAKIATTEVILALRAPDFSVEMPNGERWDAERSAAYTRVGFEQVEETLEVSFTIVELSVRDDTAAADGARPVERASSTASSV